MCDTVVAIGNSTKDGSVILGKNSNRVINETHNIEYIKGKRNTRNSKVKCSFMSIPQIEQTFDVLLLKPFWIFGCEMGANEFGVTIGNEAVYTKEPLRDKGLLGMDLMRLALERSKTAKDALEIIISLLEKYGQGGQHSYNIKGRDYHNSYIIADSKEAWVLETADRFWIVEKVKNIRTISNTLSIGSEYDLIHPDLIQHAINRGFCKSEEDFHFSNCFIPKFRFYHAVKESQPRSQFFTKGKKRMECTTALLLKNKGMISPENIMTILRNHNISPKDEEKWSPSKATAKSLCHHATGMTIPDNSVGSLVSHIKKDIQIHWVTGTSAPCISTFKPIFMPKPGFKVKQKLGGSIYNPESIWWQHEKLHRLVLLDYQKRINVFNDERNKFENKFLKKTYDLLSKISGKPSTKDIEKMTKITKDSFKGSREKTDEWITRVQDLPIESKTRILYRRWWNKFNKADQLKIN